MRRILTHALAVAAGATVAWLVFRRAGSHPDALRFGDIADPGAAVEDARPDVARADGGVSGLNRAHGPDEEGDRADGMVRAARARARDKADEVAAKRRESGEAARGRSRAVGLDMVNLRRLGETEPIVQYLTYIQSRRGDDSSLLFIRYDDIDAMAELDGQPTETFLERLDQLGVVVSNN